MGKVLIVYFSETGTVEQMAQYIAEGVRIAGQEAELKPVSEISNERDLAGYDGYIFGCPTYHLDVPAPFKSLLAMAGRADLHGKVGAAFSARTHPSGSSVTAASQLFHIMESQLRMRMTDLGPFDLHPGLFDSSERLNGSMETVRTCQQYGKAVGEMLPSESQGRG